MGSWLRSFFGARLPKFKPCIFYDERMQITELILRDCMTVWCPLLQNTGHLVDLGYDQEGELVAIKVWGDVRYNDDRCSRPILEGAELLRRLQPSR